MNVEQIKEYLSMALDMEKNKYIQEKVINKMDNEIRSLGHSRDFSSPTKQEADISFGSYIFGGAMIAGIIGYFIQLLIAFQSSSGIFGGIVAIFAAISWSLLWWALAGAVVGLICALIKRSSDQSKYDDYYSSELRQYEQKVREDEARVKKENSKKKTLIFQRNALYDKYKESCNVLNEFYACEVIGENYRGLVPIATIYQYFSDKRTFSLGFNPQTGDEGAYNIYKKELFQNIIIDKLDVIAEKLDTVIKNQATIVRTLQDANRRIDGLSNSINRGFHSIEGAINQQTAVIEYNDERKLAEQRHLSTIATWGYIDSQRNKY